MRRLLASKLGFAYLIASVILGALHVLTITIDSSVGAGCESISISVASGAISAHHLSGPGLGPSLYYAGIRQRPRSMESIRFGLWPRVRCYQDDRPPLPSNASWRTVIRRYDCLVSIPIWMLFLASSFMSWLCYFRARPIQPREQCRNCEYDLTGNTSGVCPECGTRVADDHRLPTAEAMGHPNVNSRHPR